MVVQAPPIPRPPFTEEIRIAMSFEEFLTLPETMHAEWVNGEAIIFMSTTRIHAAVVVFVLRLMADFAEEFGLGQVATAPFGMRVGPDGSYREPDLMFIANERLPSRESIWLDGPADLVIEVISEDSTGRDRAEKFYEYQDAGVREYWIFDPRPGKERIDGYQLGADGRYLAILPDEAGRYHSAVLLGFWLRLDWLMQDPLPRPGRVLAEILAERERAEKRSAIE